MRNYILILWTLFSFAGQAQSGDSEAQLLLNEVSAKVKSYRNLTLEFKYVLENTEENIRQEIGRLQAIKSKYNALKADYLQNIYIAKSSRKQNLITDFLQCRIEYY